VEIHNSANEFFPRAVVRQQEHFHAIKQFVEILQRRTANPNHGRQCF
jgi:hypothetical protein